MIAPLLQWYAVFSAVAAAFLALLVMTGRRKEYLLFFVSGAALGFYFDLSSFMNGFYSYPGFYPVTIIGLPLTMTIAEGLSVAVTIRISQMLADRLGIAEDGRQGEPKE